MKNNKLLCMLLAVLALSGCSNFLEVEPVGRTTIPVFFSDMDGLRAAMPGAYSAMYDYYDGEFYQYGDVASDMLNLNIVGSDVDLINQYNFTSSADDETEAVGHIWVDIYKAMSNINNIIKYQPSLQEKYPENSQELNKVMGEALFLRALCHFDVCRVYGQAYNYTSDASHLGVPVLVETPGPDDNVIRNTVDEVYSQILEDLDNALVRFRRIPAVDAFHVSKKAVQALLSRVYLYMEDWDNVIKYSSYVIDESQLCYGNDYVNMYQNRDGGIEAILRFSGQNKLSTLSKYYSSISTIGYPSKKLMDLFSDPQDIRLQLFEVQEGANIMTKKHALNDMLTEADRHDDPFVLRASEMYLNRAEAYLNKDMLNEAVADVKVIIARALGKDVSEISLDANDKEVLRIVIDNERAKEFCFEGQRFFDITRQKNDLVRDENTTSSVKMIAYPSDRFILPISQVELNANLNMQPNPIN